MDDNGPSVADNLRKISPGCVGSEKFFSTGCLVRKIQFSSLSRALRLAKENYYFLFCLPLESCLFCAHRVMSLFDFP